MKLLSSQIYWHKTLITLLIFAQLFGCQGWILMKEPLKNIIDENPEKVKIINHQQTEIKISFPYLECDSLNDGQFDYYSNRMITEGSISIPVEEISEIYVEKSDAHPTMVLLIFIGVITFLIVLWD